MRCPLTWNYTCGTGLNLRRTARPYARAMDAVLLDGPLKGKSIQMEPVEGRPPATLDLPGEDGATLRYGLAEWTQEGTSAEYAFLYPV